MKSKFIYIFLGLFLSIFQSAFATDNKFLTNKQSKSKYNWGKAPLCTAVGYSTINGSNNFSYGNNKWTTEKWQIASHRLADFNSSFLAIMQVNGVDVKKDSISWILMHDYMLQETNKIPRDCLLELGHLSIVQLFGKKEMFVVAVNPVTGDIFSDPVLLKTKTPHYRVGELLSPESTAHYLGLTTYTTLLGEQRLTKTFQLVKD